jgi:hypothetical protein
MPMTESVVLPAWRGPVTTVTRRAANVSRYLPAMARATSTWLSYGTPLLNHALRRSPAHSSPAISRAFRLPEPAACRRISGRSARCRSGGSQTGSQWRRVIEFSACPDRRCCWRSGFERGSGRACVPAEETASFTPADYLRAEMVDGWISRLRR